MKKIRSLQLASGSQAELRPLRKVAKEVSWAWPALGVGLRHCCTDARKDFPLASWLRLLDCPPNRVREEPLNIWLLKYNRVASRPLSERAAPSFVLIGQLSPARAPQKQVSLM